MEISHKYIERATTLLKSMVKIPSYTFQEREIADFLERYLCEEANKGEQKFKVERVANNLLLYGSDYSKEKKTLLFCAHIDTVKESENYTFDPFSAEEKEGKILGLGSNDDKGAATAAIFAFLHYINQIKEKNINVVLLLCAEEERGGSGGISLLLEKLPDYAIEPTWAVVCEPTNLEAAIAERGLLVIDATATGVSGHAAREEGVNAIYIALEDIKRLKEFKFKKISPVMGAVKLSVTQIEAGVAHNVIPDKCKFTIDIRPTDQYDNGEILSLLQQEVKSELVARNLKNRSSASQPEDLLVEWAEQNGVKKVVSPTTSDWSKIHFSAIKIGPGQSERSHKADEFIKIEELEGGIEIYINIIDFINR